MKPQKKTDRYGRTYYKLGAVDGYKPDRTQYRKYKSYYPAPGMTPAEIKRELRIKQNEWERDVRLMHAEEIKKGVTRDLGKMHFAEYADYYMEIRAENKDIKAGTVTNYTTYLDGRLKDVFGKDRMCDITTEKIDRYLNSLRKKGVRKDGGYAVPAVDFVPILKKKGLTRVAVAKKSGLSDHTVEYVVKASKNLPCDEHFSVETAKKISKALKMPVENLFYIEKNMDPLSDKTVLENYNLLCAIFGYAKRKGHIFVNPMEAVDRPRYKRKKISSLTKEELLAIHKAVMALPESKFRWKVLVILLIVTASRRGEIAGLQWKHIDFENGIVIIEQQLSGTTILPLSDGATDSTKEEDYRPIKLAPEVLELLREYRDWYEKMRRSYLLPDGTDMWRVGTNERTNKLQVLFPAEPVSDDAIISGDDFLFVQEGGFPGHPDSINSWLSEFQKKYNLAPVHPHKVRHTIASSLFEKGLRIQDIAELLGHANSSVTETVYVDVRKEAKVRLSEALMNPFELEHNSSAEN